ncbi:hypothetical protein BGZ83_002759 [Gryganskiella cystojenkinii]|nr:hypothetical protein BGZ83_002759 [Gryganskiella cystojenkinii]
MSYKKKSLDQTQQLPYSTGTQEGQGGQFAPPPISGNNGGSSAAAYGYEYANNASPVGATGYPGVAGGTPTDFLDPNVPRPNDILPLHPAIIEQRQIAASLPPCPQGGYHELRSHHALGANPGTLLSVLCFPIVYCCVRNDTVCIKCHQKFNISLPALI